MKRFHYSLEHLLSLRRYAEREAEMAMAEVIARRNTLTSRLEELHGERNRPLERGAAGGINLNFELVRAHYRMRVDRDISVTAEELSKIEGELSTARSRFAERRREREVLERLKAVRSERHYTLERKREESELGDLIGSRAVRSVQGG